MSDLQCPATFLLLAAGESQPLPPHLIEALAGEHVAEVYARAADPARNGAADTLAGSLGTRRGTADAVDVRSLEEVADLHRGERVVVLLSTAELEAVLQVAHRGVTGDPTPGWTELAVDADGWVLRAAPPAD